MWGKRCRLWCANDLWVMVLCHALRCIWSGPMNWKPIKRRQDAGSLSLSLLAPETAAVRADLAFVLLFSSLWSILKSFTFSHWVRLEGKTINLMELFWLVWLDEQLLLFLLILTTPPVFCWCMVILYLILITIKLVAFLYFFLVPRPLGADKQKPITAGCFL